MLLQKFWQRNKRVLFIAGLFMLPLVPLALMRLRLPRLNLYYHFSSRIVHPAAQSVSYAAEGVGVLWERYIALVNTAKENEGLKKENADLRGQILALEEARRESERLNQLLNLPHTLGVGSIAARVIGQDSSHDSFGFFISAGEAEGVQERMPVVAADGIVGTVLRVYKHSSLIVTLQDPAHNVDGVVTRSRARFLVEGRGKSMLGRLKYLDRAEDVRVGDLVITSGLDGVFPKGLRVGHVVRVSRPRAGVTQDADLRAAVDPGKLEEVMVLKYGEAWDKAPAAAAR